MKEQLTIKELAPYLPYSLKVIMEGKKCNVAWMSTKNISVIRPNSIGDVKKISWKYAHLNIKPILRPLSDLDFDLPKEIEKDICDNIRYNDKYSIKEWNILFKHHFDVFNLIPKGLAIDVNQLDSVEL